MAVTHLEKKCNIDHNFPPPLYVGGNKKNNKIMSEHIFLEVWNECAKPLAINSNLHGRI